MTLPIERSRSIRYARQFLYDLMDPKKTPRVPREIRKRARQALKHFPSDFYINYAADGAPSHFDHLDSEE